MNVKCWAKQHMCILSTPEPVSIAISVKLRFKCKYTDSNSNSNVKLKQSGREFDGEFLNDFSSSCKICTYVLWFRLNSTLKSSNAHFSASSLIYCTWMCKVNQKKNRNQFNDCTALSYGPLAFTKRFTTAFCSCS